MLCSKKRIIYSEESDVNFSHMHHLKSLTKKIEISHQIMNYARFAKFHYPNLGGFVGVCFEVGSVGDKITPV